MFNLLKKAAAKKQDTRAIIEQIHNEFNTAGDTALKEARDIISRTGSPNEKAARLKSIGFTSLPEVSKMNHEIIINKINEGLEEALSTVSVRYPQYKFITIDMANSICKKYGLVIGDISLYRGFVPEKNLSEIEKFYGQNNELSTTYYRRREISSPMELSKGTYDALLSAGIGNVTKNRRPLSIAAPIKYMNAVGYKLNGNFLEKEIKDPIVLAKIKVGRVDLYCIVTAWGDEASDEIVVNNKNN